MSEALHRLRTELRNSNIGGMKYISALSFGKATFNKTRFDSHISFLRTCLDRKTIPGGFQLRFNSGQLGNIGDRVLRNTSFKLIRRAVSNFARDLRQQTTIRNSHKEALQSDLDHFRVISTAVHRINSDLYTEMSEKKKAKLEILVPTYTDTSQNLKEVVCIPPDIVLDDMEKQVLCKGLNFVPSVANNRIMQQEEFEYYLKKVRHRAHHGNKDLPEFSNIFDRFKKKKESKCPDEGEFEAVDHYVDRCMEDFRNLPLHGKKGRKNLTGGEESALKRLRNRDDIVIKPADKGGAVCVWGKDQYLEEGFRQLTDRHFYEELEEDITRSNSRKVTRVVNKLIKDGKLVKEAKNLLITSPKTSAFYLLPKIHKEGTPGRPVISNISCPTYNISKFLSAYLRPIVEKLPTYIKDTTNLLRVVEDFDFDDAGEPLLFTMDVKSLYTNIPFDDGMKALKYFLEHHDEGGIDSSAILELAELVLKVNCFGFGGKLYRQICGTMMGTPFGVEFASLFVAWYEMKIRQEYLGKQPELLKRYIDDIFGATTMSKEDLLKFINFVNDYNPALKYTFKISTSVEMLDTELSIEGKKIISKIYYKPTSSHAFLNYNSDHHPQCRDNIPKGEFIRLRKNCKQDSVFNEESEKMVHFFTKREYPETIVRQALAAVRTRERLDLIKEKESKKATTRITLPLTYSRYSTAVAKIAKRHFHILSEDPLLKDLFDEPPMTAYRKGKSFRDMLVHSRARETMVGTYPCNRPRCVTCTHTTPDNYVSGPLGFQAINSRFTCESKCVVYVITCTCCGGIYVGETGRRLGDRFQQHRLDVINFSSSEDPTVVAEHFNRPGHDVSHMTVCGVFYCKNKQELRAVEQDLIRLLGAYRGECMNIDFRALDIIQDR